MATTSTEIQAYILDLIRKGQLRPNDQAPSRPELEHRFGCARATVDRAYEELKREGILRSEFGRGTFVNEPAPRARPTGRPMVVIPERSAGWQRDLWTFSIYRELARALTARGLEPQGTLEEPSAPTGPEWRTLLRACMVYWVRPSSSAVPLMQALEQERVPQLLLNRDYGPFPCVVTDAAEGQRVAVRHLAALGHKRIGFVYPPLGTPNWIDAQRVIGFLDAVQELGLPPNASPRLEISRRPGDTTDAALTEWLARPDAPTAIISPCGLAEHVARAAERNGHRVPQDLSILAIDEVLDPLGRSHRHFTCLRQRLDEIGRRAAELTPHDLQTEAGPVKIRLLPELLLGNTTARPSRKRTRKGK